MIVCPVPGGVLTAAGPVVAADGPSGTELRIPTTGGPLLSRISRIPEPAPDGEAAAPGLSAPWRRPDGAQVRGLFAIALRDS